MFSLYFKWQALRKHHVHDGDANYVKYALIQKNFEDHALACVKNPYVTFVYILPAEKNDLMRHQRRRHPTSLSEIDDTYFEREKQNPGPCEMYSESHWETKQVKQAPLWWHQDRSSDVSHPHIYSGTTFDQLVLGSKGGWNWLNESLMSTLHRCCSNTHQWM